MNKPRLSSVSALYDSKCLSLDNIIKMNRILLIYNIKNNLIKNNTELIMRESMHSHNTRSRSEIYIPNSYTNLGLFSTVKKATFEYNHVPDNIKAVGNTVVLKRSLRAFLGDN